MKQENQKRAPSPKCIFCQKSLEEIGGSRIVVQKSKRISFSSKHRSGGDSNFTIQSHKLQEYPEPIYMIVWGEKGLWRDVLIERAKEEYLNGYQPWFCQICGKMICSECGDATKLPLGSDVLCVDGSILHVAKFPVDPGCTNKDCINHQASFKSNG